MFDFFKMLNESGIADAMSSLIVFITIILVFVLQGTIEKLRATVKKHEARIARLEGSTTATPPSVLIPPALRDEPSDPDASPWEPQVGDLVKLVSKNHFLRDFQGVTPGELGTVVEVRAGRENLGVFVAWHTELGQQNGPARCTPNELRLVHHDG